MFFLDYWYISLHKTDKNHFLFKPKTKAIRTIGLYVVLYFIALLASNVVNKTVCYFLCLVVFLIIWVAYTPNYIDYLSQKFDNLEETTHAECKKYILLFKILAWVFFALLALPSLLR